MNERTAKVMVPATEEPNTLNDINKTLVTDGLPSSGDDQCRELVLEKLDTPTKVRLIRLIDEQLKIDIETINSVSDTTLAEYLPLLGDRAAVRNFAAKAVKESSTAPSTVTRRSTLMAILRDRVTQEEGAVSTSPVASTSKRKRLKATRKIEINWKHNGKPVWPAFGGGKRKLDMPQSSTKSDIMQEAKHLFFPNGKSRKGNLQDCVKVELTDFKGDILPDDMSVAECYDLYKIGILTFYLSTCTSSDNITHSDANTMPERNTSESEQGKSIQDVNPHNQVDTFPPVTLSGATVTSVSPPQYSTVTPDTLSLINQATGTIMPATSSTWAATAEVPIGPTINGTVSTSVAPSLNSIATPDTLSLISQATGIAVPSTSSTWAATVQAPIAPTINGTVATSVAPPLNSIATPDTLSLISQATGIAVPSTSSTGAALAATMASGNMLFLPDLSDEEISFNLNYVSPAQPGVHLRQTEYTANLDEKVVHIKLHRGMVFSELNELVHNGTLTENTSSISVEMVLPNGRIEAARDTGGVLRDSLTEYFETFYMKCTNGNTVRIPVTSVGMTNNWRSVVVVIAVGLRCTGYFPVALAKPFVMNCVGATVTDEATVKCFLETVPSDEKDLIQMGWNDFSSIETDDLFDFLEAHEVRTIVNENNFKRVMSELAHKEIIQDPAYISDVWGPVMKGLQSSFQLDELFDRIVPSNLKVLNILQFEDGLNQTQANVASFLKKFVRGCNHERLKKFMRFCTGADLLLCDCIQIRFIGSTSEFRREPVGHTCGCVLELPDSYTSALELREELTNVLDSNIWVMDII